jgi:hypothetical protein
LNIICVYLSPAEITRLFSTNKEVRKKLKDHQEIILNIRDGTIYQDAKLLDTVYTKFPQYFINWKSVENKFERY